VKGKRSFRDKRKVPDQERKRKGNKYDEID